MARNIQGIVEEQIARWRAESRSRPHTNEPPAEPPTAIVFSHALGSYGVAIALQVGRQLSIPVYDREILEHIASHARVQLATVETLDERAQGIVDDYLTSIFRESGFDHSDYMSGLGRVVAALWQHGSCVMVGHGCVHLVPRSHALAVRTTAPVEERVRRLALVADLDPIEARRRVTSTDTERAAFHKQRFGIDVEDIRSYDIILDTQYLDILGSAAVIAHAYEQRFGAHRP
ncbi:MAG: cytidylate kinase-like family protein [Pseudomonadota bacterium]